MYQDKFIQAGLKILLAVLFMPTPTIRPEKEVMLYQKLLRLTGLRRLLR